MLRILTTALRRRAGLILALGYLACVIALPAATALGGVCPVDDHHVAATVHVHGDGGTHHQEPQGPDQKQVDSDGKVVPGNCCGTTCLNAIADRTNVAVGATTFARVILPALEAARGGLAPQRLDRPPDVLLPI